MILLHGVSKITSKHTKCKSPTVTSMQRTVEKHSSKSIVILYAFPGMAVGVGKPSCDAPTSSIVSFTFQKPCNSLHLPDYKYVWVKILSLWANCSQWNAGSSTTILEFPLQHQSTATMLESKTHPPTNNPLSPKSTPSVSPHATKFGCQFLHRNTGWCSLQNITRDTALNPIFYKSSF